MGTPADSDSLASAAAELFIDELTIGSRSVEAAADGSTAEV